MKRVLLGTTALVAAGMIGAGDAQAKFDVTVNGEFYTGYIFVNEDDDREVISIPGTPSEVISIPESGYGRQNQAINQDYEVHFRAVQTLDNGIVVGAKVQLEGATNGGNGNRFSRSAGNDQIDERQIYFRGGFGEIRVGDEDDARKLKSYTAPDPTGFIFGVNSPYFIPRNLASPAVVVTGTGTTATTALFPTQVISSNSTTANLENDSAKVIYFSPVFSGFQFVVSYAPDGTQDRSTFGTGGTQETQVSNATSIAADYSGEFNGVTIGLGGGYSWGNVENSDEDPSIFAAGINIGFAGFTVGGSIAVGDETDATGYNGYSVNEATVFDVGITYTMDAVTVGLGWSHGEYEQTSDGQDDEDDEVQLGARYALGEGVDIAAFIGWFDYDDGGPGDVDNTGWGTGVGSSINF